MQKMSTQALEHVIAYSGFCIIRNSVLSIKIIPDQTLRFYKSIFQKVAMLYTDLVKAYFGIRNSFMNTEVHQDWSSGLNLHVDCAKNVNLSPWACNCIFKVLHYQKLSFDYKNYPRSNTVVLHVNFSKHVNVINWPCNGIFWGLLTSETH